MKSDIARDFSALAADANAYRQQVRLAAVQIAGLRPDELAQALAYELEPSSGIPAAEAEVVYQPVADPDPTVRVFNVAVRRHRRRSPTAGLARWLKPATAFGLLLLLLCAADATCLLHHKCALSSSVTERRPLQAELDRLNERARAASSEVARVRAARDAAVQAQEDVARRRMAYLDLLNAIAAAFGKASVVTSFGEGENGAILVRAIAGTADTAAAVMRDLTLRAAACHWSLVPGQIRASASGQTAQFDFTLVRRP